MNRNGPRAASAPFRAPHTGARPERDAFKLDRRSEPRDPDGTRTELTASYTNHDDRVGITHMTVVDRSARGLGVLTTTRIEPGMSVTINSKDHELSWLKATAVRCTRQGERYHVGLRLSTTRTAA